MLWTIAAILFILWCVGILGSYTMGGFIHVLLIAAAVTVFVQFIQGRKVIS